MTESARTFPWFLLILLSSISTAYAQCRLVTLTTSDSTGTAYYVGDDFWNGAGGTATCTLYNCHDDTTSFSIKFDPDRTTDWQGVVQGSCPLTATATADARTTHLAVQVQGRPNVEYRVDCSCDAPYPGGPPGGFDPIGHYECFSATTVVHVLDKGVVLMKDLRIGDKVLTASNEYQPVYSFGHLDTDGIGTFFQIYTDNTTTTGPLEMTGEHLIFVRDKGQRRAIRVDQLQVGDQIALLTTGSTTVTKITTKELTGLYMPLTMDGTIVVHDGLVASTYVSLQKQAPMVVESLRYFFLTEQMLIHWWMSPNRLFYKYWGVESLGSSQSNNTQQDHTILPWLTFGNQLVQDAETDTFLVRVVVKGVPLFLLLGCVNLLEYLFFLGESLSRPAMGVFIFMSMAAYFWNRWRRNSLHKGSIASPQFFIRWQFEGAKAKIA